MRYPACVMTSANRAPVLSRWPAGWLALAWQFFAAIPGLGAETLVVPPDSNSRITVENTLSDNGATAVFFLSWPDLGDPLSGKPCALNYYRVRVRPGLADPHLETVAREVCGGLTQTGAILPGGDASILIAGNWQRWRDGEQRETRALNQLEALSSMGFTDAASLPDFFAHAANGDLVAAVLTEASSGERNDIGGELNVARLTPEGKLRWKSHPADSVAGVTRASVWAGADEGALVHVSAPASGDTLLVYDRHGNLSRYALAAGDPMLAGASLDTMDAAQAQAFFQSLAHVQPESIEKLAAHGAPGGGWDVLFDRRGSDARRGHFLVSIAANGKAVSERNLSAAMGEYGIEDWYDFYVDANELLLLSRAVTTQKIIDGKPRRRAQNIVSWIDLAQGTVSTHLIPLDERYLDAALAAGDADIQYLDGLPDSEPVLLGRLGGLPLVVSIGRVGHRQVLRLHEASRDLETFTEAVEKRRAGQARAAAREQREADREALAAAVAAGDLSAAQAMAASMREARLQSAAPANAPAAAAGDFNTQLAAAMQQAQQEMANAPGMTPEMLAQMQAAMAQVSQGLGGASPAAPVPAQNGPAAGPDSVLALDQGGRAVVKCAGQNGEALSLRVYDRRTGGDLFTRASPNGRIREDVDFSQFGLPLERIGVACLDSLGRPVMQFTLAGAP